MSAGERWLVTGANGRLGRELVRLLTARDDVETTAADRRTLDLTDPATSFDLLDAHDIVVNAAAWTDVDGAEKDEPSATEINSHAVRRLARACARRSVRLIHVSTGYVFSGRARIPYREDAPAEPINAYGRSKLAGEQALLTELPELGHVVRTSWLYGDDGPDFLVSVLGRGRRGEPVNVVTDQRGQPTSIPALARQIIALGRAGRRGTAAPGIYHGTSAGHASWYELARAAFALAGADPDLVLPVTTAEYDPSAPRPEYTVLAHTRWAAAGLPDQPHWHDQLVGFLTRRATAPPAV
ncbi:NAD(P)-dependent oxidoreductase [Mangrovihabitans endophyticus]|uniref:dTDP-4-dehydrorhamnose reductase n=2 Tax=Mangrovihabitans endophyticus TaxID=1751298 RepID=A0A8J3BTC7_9ACTN|nr:NAD(P)-dependent oxidoreductase [Mangrovihabitans endophyticus]